MFPYIFFAVAGHDDDIGALTQLLQDRNVAWLDKRLTRSERVVEIEKEMFGDHIFEIVQEIFLSQYSAEALT